MCTIDSIMSSVPMAAGRAEFSETPVEAPVGIQEGGDYFIVSHQPTNQPTTTNLSSLPSHYLSVRIKVDHAKLDVVLAKVVLDVPSYCIYLHSTGSEHMHICLPGLGSSDNTRLGKRIRDNLGVRGNGGYSIKSHDNGCGSFVFYCGHEGTTPIYQDQSWKAIIEGTETYYVKQTGQKMLPMDKKGKEVDADWQLTYANFVSKAIDHARSKGLTGGLKEVLEDLLDNTRWKPSFQMVRYGVPEHYYHDFERRTGKRQKRSMDWMTPKI